MLPICHWSAIGLGIRTDGCNALRNMGNSRGEFLPSAREEPQGFEMSVKDGGLSACVRRHALSKWCRVIEIASEVSLLGKGLDR